MLICNSKLWYGASYDTLHFSCFVAISPGYAQPIISFGQSAILEADPHADLSVSRAY